MSKSWPFTCWSNRNCVCHRCYMVHCCVWRSNAEEEVIIMLYKSYDKHHLKEAGFTIPWNWVLGGTIVTGQIARENCPEPENSSLVFVFLCMYAAFSLICSFVSFQSTIPFFAPCPVLSDSAPSFHSLHLGSVSVAKNIRWNKKSKDFCFTRMLQSIRWNKKSKAFCF